MKIIRIRISNNRQHKTWNVRGFLVQNCAFRENGSKRVVSLPGNYFSNQKLHILLLYENWSNLTNVDFRSQKK